MSPPKPAKGAHVVHMPEHPHNFLLDQHSLSLLTTGQGINDDLVNYIIKDIIRLAAVGGSAYC